MAVSTMLKYAVQKKSETLKKEPGPGIYGLICWSVLFFSIVFRFAALSLKPPHADEGVNGYFVNQIWQNGFFTYDPANYHGPLLFYLFQLSERILGFGVASFRFVTAFFSVLTVWLILKSREELGRYAPVFMALGLAFSPGMIFFGRSAIHEAVFVFFQVLWVTGLLKFKALRDREALLMVAAGVLGCMLLKETFIILTAALFISWAWAEIYTKAAMKKAAAYNPEEKKSEEDLLRNSSQSGKRVRLLDSAGTGIGKTANRFDDTFLLKVCFACALIWLSLFTGFFHNLRGAADFFTALVPWLKTGSAGAGHQKPFLYWLDLMRHYEWPALAGFALALPGLASRVWKIRFFSCLALTNWLIYSVIPYKTPWCIITILWPFLIVAAFYAEKALDRFKAGRKLGPMLAGTCLLLVVAHSAFTSYKLNFVNYAQASEPYVYVQTTKDFSELERIVKNKIRLDPEAVNMVVQENFKDAAWPLPWVFSRFPNEQFGDEKRPLNPKADIILAESSADCSALSDLFLRKKMELREARQPIYIYLKKSTFEGIPLPGYNPVKGS